MQRKLIFMSMLLALGLLLAIPVSAHTPMLYVEDYGDGTIFLEGGFSDGSSAAGVEILLVEDKDFAKDTKVRDNYLSLIFKKEDYLALRDGYLKYIVEKGSEEYFSELLNLTKVKGDKIIFNKEGKEVNFSKLKPELFEGKLIIFRCSLDEYSTLNLPKPEDSYLVIFNGGPGHTVKKDGPVLTEEEKGFLEE